MKKKASKSECDYLGKIASLGCCLCHMLGYGHNEAQVHHVREGQGMSQRAQHFATIPLCPTHHLHNVEGWHGQRQPFKLHSIDEVDMLAWVNKKLHEAA